jgi:hypothetical protein
LGYPALVGYTPTIDFSTFMNIPLCSGHIQNQPCWIYIILLHPTQSYRKTCTSPTHSLVFTSFNPLELGLQDFRVALLYSFSAPTFTSRSIKCALKAPPLLNFPFRFISFILPYHVPTNQQHEERQQPWIASRTFFT